MRSCRGRRKTLGLSNTSMAASSQISTLSRFQLECALLCTHQNLTNLNNSSLPTSPTLGSPNPSFNPYDTNIDGSIDGESEYPTPPVLHSRNSGGESSIYSPQPLITMVPEALARQRSTDESSNLPFGNTLMLDWNVRYQNAMLSGNWSEVNNVTKEFSFVARKYASILVEEKGLPISQRTFTPLSAAGGLAGGEKYLIHGVLFKFAIDFVGIYDGDEGAAKAAGHELKGMDGLAGACGARDPQKYYSTPQHRRGAFGGSSMSAKVKANDSDSDADDSDGEFAESIDPARLHFPLQCCVDYRGFRLVASSLLPIEGASTLVYGICDPTNFGREEIKNGDKDLGVKLAMARVAAQMNLKPHLVGPAPYTTSIHHCVDLEVHRSQKDTKVYCLDFARVMPPEWAGQGGEKGRHLKCLLRREFVEKWKFPLSSDSLSKFTVSTSRQQELEEVAEATNWLRTTLVPHFALKISQLYKKGEVGENSYKDGVETIHSVIEKMHRCGINLRLLGSIRVALLSSRGNNKLATVILAEMVARVAKDDLNELFRKTTSKHKLPGVVKFEVAAVKYLNKLFGTGSSLSESFWGGVLPFRLGNKFGSWYVESESEAIEMGTWRTKNLGKALPFVYKRVCQMTGIKIDPETSADLKLSANFQGKKIFENVDVLEIEPRERLPAVVSFSEAMELVEKAKSGESVRLWKMAGASLLRTVQRTPNSPSALSHLSSVLCQIAKETSIDPDLQSILLGKAGRRALESLTCGEDAWKCKERCENVKEIGVMEEGPSGRKTSVLSPEQQMYDEYDLSPTSPQMSRENSKPCGVVNNHSPSTNSIMSQIEHYTVPNKNSYEDEYKAVQYDDFYDGEYEGPYGEDWGASETNHATIIARLDLDDFVVLHRDLNVYTVDEYDIKKVNFDGASSYDREGTALALNTVGKCLHLLSELNEDRELEFLDMAIAWFSAGARLAGFQDDGGEEKEKKKTGAIRRSSHHLSITSRVGDGLESALCHASCLLRRSSVRSDPRFRRQDIDAALNLASGVKSFLNVQAHSNSSEVMSKLNNRTNDTLKKCEECRDDLINIEISFEGRKSLPDSLSSDPVVLIGSGSTSTSTYMTYFYSSGLIKTFKHESHMFIASKSITLEEEILRGGCMENVGVSCLITSDNSCLFIDNVSLDIIGTVKLDYEITSDIDICSKCLSPPEAAGGYFGALEFCVVVEWREEEDVEGIMILGHLNVAAEKGHVLVLGADVGGEAEIVKLGEEWGKEWSRCKFRVAFRL
ncbi:hypothetical protein TrLO_g3914 [Triparma laevis f. longispina]|uniref:Clu domain-containing protein n=1 Tax=Triparma laevis f. longispina TaxID=1714387 RepID=A0A9W7KZZ9_9STRA|nr:hypothetical protein TrLO_g3914 [Triparma laevis f. longispina]